MKGSVSLAIAVALLAVGMAATAQEPGWSPPVPAAGSPVTTPPAFQFGDSAAGNDQQQNPVTVKAVLAQSADGKAQLQITATIEPKWHIYSITQAAGGPIATTIELASSPDYRVGGPFQASQVPDVEVNKEAFGDLKIESHHGTVTWFAPVELGVDPSKVQIRGKITVQPCTGQNCIAPMDLPFAAALNPEAKLLGVDVVKADKAIVHQSGAAPSGPPPAPMSLPLLLALAFGGGFILNFMPCVLPVIGLKILSFIEQAGESRAKVFALNVWYSAGLMSVFMVLAATVTFAGQTWGEQFTKPWFVVTLTSLVFAMALSFLGVWEIPIPGFVGTGGANKLQAQEGASGAFFKGVFATILATPCGGPLVGPIFGSLLGKPALLAFGVFGAMGFGMAAPYLLIGAFPGLMRYLPRPGAWMETFKQAMAFLLLATVVFLFTTFSPIYFIPTLALLFGIWFAVWLIGRTPLTASPAQQTGTWVGAILSAGLVGLVSFTLLVGTPIAPVAEDGRDSLASQHGEAGFPWRPYSPAAVERARQEGKTVMVDFSANWCLTCKWNLKTAIETERVRELIERNQVVTMLADFTDGSPVVKKSLNDLGFNSIPLLVIYPAAPDAKPITRPDLLTESVVLDALKEAGPSRPAAETPGAKPPATMATATPGQ